MDKDQSSQHTSVIASYWNRGEAEIARDHLEKAGISAFVSADDAGGLHPELQLSQGVHLVVLGNNVQHARKLLEEANLLPSAQQEAIPEKGDPIALATRASGIRMLLLVFAVLAAILVVGMLLR